MTSSLKYHQDTRFRNCFTLAHTHDPHRNRNVTLHLIPGRFDIVGVNDGVETWVAPVIADPFSVNVKAMLEKVQAGTPLHELEVIRHRKKLSPDVAAKVASTKQEAPKEEPEPAPRRRLLLAHQPVRKRAQLKRRI